MTMKLRKISAIFVSIILILCLASTMAFASSRKLITKNVSGSFWINGNFSYSFNATAGITYQGSSILGQSDLSFSSMKVTSNVPGVVGTIIPKQSRKYISGTSAVYVVTVSRNATGVYVDKIDYTLTYRASDAGKPYSLGENEEPMFLVDIEVGEPYDIQYFEE